MADLLSKKNLTVVFLALLFTSSSGYCYESSFPFPFEFGHSSDIYLDVKKPETKADRVQNQAARDILRERGINTSPEDFLKYIKQDDVGLIKLILDAGFDPNACINGNYAIYWAAKYNRKQIAYLLLEKGASPNNDMNSCLRPAILNKDYEFAKILIDHGANVNYVDTFSTESLLYTALKKKQYDIARLLLKSGAKIDADSYKYIKKKDLERKIGIFVD